MEEVPLDCWMILACGVSVVKKAGIAESLMNLISVCSLIGASGFVRRIGHCPGSLVYGVMFQNLGYPKPGLTAEYGLNMIE